MQKYATGLTPLFNPKSVAAVGSLRETGVGAAYTTTKNLLKFGFPGKIYPVSPSYDTAFNIKVYSSVMEIHDAIDLAIITTPPQAVLNI